MESGPGVHGDVAVLDKSLGAQLRLDPAAEADH